MLNVKIAGASVFKSDAPLTAHEVCQRVEDVTGLSRGEYYISHNGRVLQDGDVCSNGRVAIILRVLGGKGGFGSMLRAIGAQIEKTTNREACRDLSGRRLRDINEEKRLKAWIQKRNKRHKEAEERKERKLAKLCAEPRHEFKDDRYEQERAELTERVGDAVEEGFKAAGPSGVKRSIEEELKPNKRRTLLDLDINSDEFESSSDDSDISHLGDTDDSDDSDDDENHEHDTLFVEKSEEKQEKLNDNDDSDDSDDDDNHENDTLSAEKSEEKQEILNYNYDSDDSDDEQS